MFLPVTPPRHTIPPSSLQCQTVCIYECAFGRREESKEEGMEGGRNGRREEGMEGGKKEWKEGRRN